jgi:hypothetical protein
VVGGSTGGAVGVFPANGFSISLTTAARTVETLGAGVEVVGVAGDVVTVALGVTGKLCAVEDDDGVDAVVAVCGTTTLGVDSALAVDGVVTTTWLVALVPLSVPAAEEAGELAVTPVGLDDRPLLGCGVASVPVALPVLDVEFWVPAFDGV